MGQAQGPGCSEVTERCAERCGERVSSIEVFQNGNYSFERTGLADVYTITLDKGQDGTSKLGLDVEHIVDGEALPIRRINGGLAAEWSATHPECPVRVNDRIIEVNGIRGDVP